MFLGFTQITHRFCFPPHARPVPHFHEGWSQPLGPFSASERLSLIDFRAKKPPRADKNDILISSLLISRDSAVPSRDLPL